MRCMLASLPLSLVSCLMSVASRSSSEPAAPPAPAAAPETPQAMGQSRIVAQRWLADGGLEVLSMTWQGFEQSHLPCSPQPADGEAAMEQPPLDGGGAPGGEPPRCEEHMFRVQTLTRGSGVDRWVRVRVTIDPSTGAVAGVHMTADESQLSSERPVWGTQPGSGADGDGLTESLRGILDATAAEWASAWALGWKNDSQEALRKLAGADGEESDGPPDERAWLGMIGWEAIPDSVKVLSRLMVGPSGPPPSPYLITVEFKLAQRCVWLDEQSVNDDGYDNMGKMHDYYPPRCADECPTPDADAGDADAGDGFTVLDEAAGRAVCDRTLSVSADLHVEIDRGEDTVTVVDYGEVGAFAPAQILLDRQGRAAAV